MAASFMKPDLHPDVHNAVSSEIPGVWFKKKNTDKGSNNDWNTHVKGRFTCTNKDCKNRGWGSGKIATQIRGYPNNGYNAVVFNQRCKSCQRLGVLALDEGSYVERVARRIKIWAGVPVEEAEYREGSGPEHESALCEGCKRGVCEEGRD